MSGALSERSKTQNNRELSRGDISKLSNHSKIPSSKSKPSKISKKSNLDKNIGHQKIKNLLKAKAKISLKIQKG
jgi:hypothetical protein